MKILYITYIDFDGSGKSGSSVRPQKMYEAFLNLGLDVKLLECQQNKFKERRKKVREILEWLDNNTPDICYIESPSGPIFNQIDLKLIKKVHNMGVPIGYFYRDAFWLFPEMQKKIKLIKRHLINFMNLRDLHVLENNCDIVYFPTNSAISLFDFSNIKKVNTLPPAADVENLHSTEEIKKNCIYVGAVSKVDGTFEIINAFRKLNEEKQNISLTIVCRKNEWDIIQPYLNVDEKPPWLKIAHVSGKQLDEYYNASDLALFPRQEDKYIDMAMPVKLFEYISYGKPIVSTKRTEVRKFIEENNCGIICDDDYMSVASAVKYYYDNESLRKQLINNVSITASKNRWIDRAEKVILDLISIGERKNS